MPNTASAIRRVRRVKNQSLVNKIRKSKYKSAIKKMETYVKNGEKDIAVLSHKDLRKFLKKSKNNNPVWTDWSEEMSTKTLIKMLTKQNELSNEKKG